MAGWYGCTFRKSIALKQCQCHILFLSFRAFRLPLSHFRRSPVHLDPDTVPSTATQNTIALQPPKPLSLFPYDFLFIPFYDLHITFIRSSDAPTPSPQPLFQCNSREAEGTSSSRNPVLHSDKKTCRIILDLS